MSSVSWLPHYGTIISLLQTVTLNWVLSPLCQPKCSSMYPILICWMVKCLNGAICMNAAEHYIIYIVCIQNIQSYTLSLLLLWYKQRAFSDVKVFNPFAKSYRDIPLTKCYKRCEQQKKRTYKERIHKVKHGPFTPLIFSTQGGMRRQQPCASVLPPFCQARDQNRIPGQSTGSDAGLDLLFSGRRSCAWKGPLLPSALHQEQHKELWFSSGPRNQRGEDPNNYCYSILLTTLLITIVTVLLCCSV